MRKLFFPIALVATIILGVLAYFIWSAAPRTSQSYFESGKKYYDQKKYPEATIQFLNAVRKDARSRDARYLLAMSYMNRQDLTKAAGQLKALLEYYPADVEANLRLGDIYVIAGRTNSGLLHEAQEIAKKILAADPQNVNALILSGNTAAGLQDFSASSDLFEKAIGLDPQNLVAFVNLGATEALQKNYAGAEKAFLKAHQLNPKDRIALLALANYYRSVGNFDKAEAIFREGLSTYPGDRAIYIQAVQFYSRAGRFEEVEKILHEAQAKSADDPAPSLLLVQLYELKARRADARKLLMETKNKFPKNIAVAGRVALDSMQDHPDRARAEIDQIIKAEPKNPAGYILLGQLQYLSGQYDAAEATFGKDPAVNSPFAQPHFFLGNIAMRKGQIDQALSHYQKSLSVNSGYLPARVALAEVFLDKGRLADSKEELKKALDMQPGFLSARILKATIDTAEKNYSAAEQEWTTLAKEQPNNAAIYRQVGLFYESRGRTSDAEKNLTHAVELQPGSEQILRDLTLYYLRQRQPDRALQKINAVPDPGKQAFHYELMGIIYSQSGKYPDAEKAYEKALQKDPSRSSSDMLLFENYIRSSHVDEALRKLDEIIKKNPKNGFPYTLKASIYESQGKTEQAKDIYGEALKADPNSEIAANNLAFILAEEGRDLQSALGFAQMARKKQPENPGIADTLGWVYYKLGNYVLARDQLQFAASKQPENSAFQYHLGMIYKETKQINDAQTALKKAIKASKDSNQKNKAQVALNEIAKLN